MWLSQIFTGVLWGSKVKHQFLVFDFPQEKYGHHTALVWHEPKNKYCMVVARFGRMRKEIADAEFLGEIDLRTPHASDVEDQANALDTHYMTAKSLFEELARSGQRGNKLALGTAAVYLVQVRTRHFRLLYDGSKASLPSGYLTFYTGKSS
ncbi:hypothetical protein R3P38DRAFT_2904216 [Favolaschia claudopus]|uniref:Uncharacterized protein n=1 Tax=Favolaschia claudopus TaxID=2862362 RepID=A0AAW0CGR5_9AGAR